MPLPFLLTVLGIGLLLICFSPRKQTLGKILACFSFVTLFLLSFPPVANSLARSVEQTHPALLNANNDYVYILVLGHTGSADPSLPVTGQLSSTALARFSEAFRLSQLNPSAKLLLTGPRINDSLSYAELVRRLALSFGLDENRIETLPSTRDTDDEAREMCHIITNEKAALVTSASHMRRAMTLFEKYGCTPDAAPADYLVRQTGLSTSMRAYLPRSHHLRKSEIAIHEILGLWWAKLRQITGFRVI